MSSILKALKKIEEDSPPPPAYPSLPQPVNSPKALNNSTRKRWRMRRLSYLLIVLLFIGAGTGLIYRQRGFFFAQIKSLISPQRPQTGEMPASSGNKVYRAKIPPPPTVTVPKSSPVNRRPQGQIRKKGPETSENKIQSAKRPRQRGALPPRTSARESQAVLNSRAKTAPPTVSGPAGLQTRRKTTAPKINPSPPPSAKAKSRVQPKPKVAYDRFDDANLTLQALAWTEDAARRMVVINGQIVHEGESVDGYQIIKIREEDVIVKQGSKSWRLEFGLQQ